MADILIPRLPRFVNQFAASVYDEHPSLFRCGTAAGSICLDFAYPGHYDPYKVEHDEYQKLVGPDTPSDQNGVTDAKMEQFFADFRVGTIYMHDLVMQGFEQGEYAPLLAEIEAQNRQGVIQFLSVADESSLIDAKTGASLHPGLHYGHCIVRLGFSDDTGVGYYFDPAAAQAQFDPATKSYKPVEISWEASIVHAKVNCVFAIMPPGVPAPPAGFSYQHGTWPAAKPVIDFAKMLNNLNAIAGVGGQLTNLANDIAKDIAALKEAGA